MQLPWKIIFQLKIMLIMITFTGSPPCRFRSKALFFEIADKRMGKRKKRKNYITARHWDRPIQEIQWKWDSGFFFARRFQLTSEKLKSGTIKNTSPLKFKDSHWNNSHRCPEEYSPFISVTIFEYICMSKKKRKKKKNEIKLYILLRYYPGSTLFSSDF